MDRKTRKDAVNDILAAIGEQPVNSIEGNDIPLDVSVILRTLNEVSREVQEKGWKFNTERTELEADSNGNITVADNVAKVDFTNTARTEADPVLRGGNLYDVYNATDNFGAGKSFKAEVVYLFDFDELPSGIKHYIATKAGRRFLQNYHPDRESVQFSGADEADALAEARREDANNADRNIFNNRYGLVTRLRRSRRRLRY